MIFPTKKCQMDSLEISLLKKKKKLVGMGKMPLQELLWIHEFKFDLPFFFFPKDCKNFPKRK